MLYILFWFFSPGLPIVPVYKPLSNCPLIRPGFLPAEYFQALTWYQTSFVLIKQSPPCPLSLIAAQLIPSVSASPFHSQLIFFLYLILVPFPFRPTFPRLPHQGFADPSRYSVFTALHLQQLRCPLHSAPTAIRNRVTDSKGFSPKAASTHAWGSPGQDYTRDCSQMSAFQGFSEREWGCAGKIMIIKSIIIYFLSSLGLQVQSFLLDVPTGSEQAGMSVQQTENWLRLFAGAAEHLVQVFRQDRVMWLENSEVTPQQGPSCGSHLLLSAPFLLLTTEPNRFLTQKVFAKFCVMQPHILAGFEFWSYKAVNIIYFLCSDRQSPQTWQILSNLLNLLPFRG